MGSHRIVARSSLHTLLVTVPPRPLVHKEPPHTTTMGAAHSVVAVAYVLYPFISETCVVCLAVLSYRKLASSVWCTAPFETEWCSAANRVFALPELCLLIVEQGDLVGAFRLKGVCMAARDGAKSGCEPCRGW
jgi:hypothetical protein